MKFFPKLHLIEVYDIEGDNERLLSTMWFISEEDFTSTATRLTTSAAFNSLRRDRKKACLIKVTYGDSRQDTYYTDEVTIRIKQICEEYQQTYSRAEQMLQPAKWTIKGWLLGPEKRLISILKLMPAAKQIHEQGPKAEPHIKSIIYTMSAAVLFVGCDILYGSDTQPNPKPCKNVYRSEYDCLDNKTYVAQDLSKSHDADHTQLAHELRAVTYHVRIADSAGGIVSIQTKNSIINMKYEYSVTSNDSCRRILRFPVYDPRAKRYVLADFTNQDGGTNFAFLNTEAGYMMLRYSLSYSEGRRNDYLINLRSIDK